MLNSANLSPLLPVGITALFLLFGGASRNDALSQVVVGLIAIAALCWGLFRSNRETWRRGRAILALLGALVLLNLLQLLPLPPGLWASLPGRSGLATDLAGIGLGEVWRPISLAPDRTISSLLGLLPPVAVAVLLANARRDIRLPMLTLLVATVALSGLLGAAQVASGVGYFYRITNEGAAVGLFANRNHQAALLACGLPITAGWMVWPRRNSRAQRNAMLLGLCVVGGIYPLLMITGSRAGILLGALATVAAALVGWLGWGSARIGSLDRRRLRPLLVAPFAIGAVLALTTILASRDVALQRLFAPGQDSIRRELLPVYLDMAKTYFPLGSGFGSFDPVFRMVEPMSNLSPTYLNQAHNDLVQLAIEAGLPGLLLGIVGPIVILIVGLRGLRGRRQDVPPSCAAMALSVLALLVTASAVDYPLRTPGLAVLFTLFAAFLLIGPHDAGRSAERVGSPSHID